MIEYHRGDILQTGAEALVNTVNCVGVMGRGMALQVKKAFPGNFKAYAAACEKKEVRLGKMFVFETRSMPSRHLIINFPTKRHWRGQSKLEDIKAGLHALVETVHEHNIKSLAVPPLGCGLGGLDWTEVRPLIVEAMRVLPDDVRVLVYEPDEAPPNKDGGQGAGNAAHIGGPKKGEERLLALRSLAGALRARLRFHAQCGLADYPFIAPPRRKEARQEAKPAAPPPRPRTVTPCGILGGDVDPHLSAGPPQGPRTAAPVPPPRPQAPPGPIVEATSPPDPDRLAEAQSAMRTCAECPLATAAIRMCGRGRAGAPLAVVGDHLAPGATADHCFGPGEDEMLWIMMGHEKTLGLGPEDVYVTNLLKCAPPAGKKPDPANAARCLPHLLAELDAARPRLVCVMGDLATRVLLGGRAAVAHMRGRPHTLNTPGGRHILMVTYHPRFLLRAQDMKKAAMDDLLKMRELLAGRR